MIALRKYIPDFDKNAQFLEKDQWVRLLLEDNRLITACERAETFAKNKTADDTISYSNYTNSSNCYFLKDKTPWHFSHLLRMSSKGSIN